MRQGLFGLLLFAVIGCAPGGCAYPGLSTKVATVDDVLAVGDCLAPAALTAYPQLSGLEGNAQDALHAQGATQQDAILSIGAFIVQESVSLAQCAALRAAVRHAKDAAHPDLGPALSRRGNDILQSRQGLAEYSICRFVREDRAADAAEVPDENHSARSPRNPHLRWQEHVGPRLT